MMDRRNQEAITTAKTLLAFVNSLNCNEELFAETVCRDHRTLQQSVMRLFIAFCKRIAVNSYDRRNEDAVRLAQKIMEITDNYSLPFI